MQMQQYKCVLHAQIGGSQDKLMPFFIGYNKACSSEHVVFIHILFWSHSGLVP